MLKVGVKRAGEELGRGVCSDVRLDETNGDVESTFAELLQLGRFFVYDPVQLFGGDQISFGGLLLMVSPAPVHQSGDLCCCGILHHVGDRNASDSIDPVCAEIKDSIVSTARLVSAPPSSLDSPVCQQGGDV